MFLGVGEFLDRAVVFRSIWPRGRLGGGKTLFAVALAKRLIDDGLYRYAISNMPLALPANPDGTVFDSVVILDEGWVHLDARSYLSNPRRYGAFARKLRTCWLLPSVYGVDKRLRPVWVERTYRLDFIPGELWVYRWGVDLGYMRDEGRFFLWRPSLYYPLYDHTYIPGTGPSEQILEAALARTFDAVGYNIARLDKVPAGGDGYGVVG